MDYSVKIDNFEGPLDLLLHLIKESNVEIYDISIDEITKQYLDYINKMEELNLNIASEYLVMAAELLEMKSKLLLPKKEKLEGEDEEAYNRENLINRLIEYQKYKEVTNTLREFKDDRENYYTKIPSNIKEYVDDDTTNLNIEIEDLLSAFQNYLKRKQYEKPLNTVVTKKEFSVSERSMKIKSILKIKKKINFEELFDVINRPYVVVTFLSLLDLVKNKEVTIKQDNNFGGIQISLRGE